MKLKLQIWHLIFLFALFLLIVRIDLVANTIALFLQFVELFFNNVNMFAAQADFRLCDSFFSVFLLFFIPAFVFTMRKKISFLSKNLTLNYSLLILLLFFFLLAPLITNSNPDFQQNIAATKLLPPLSVVKVIHVKSDLQKEKNLLNEFLELRKKVAKKSFDPEVIFADSIRPASSLVYYQKDRAIEINSDLLIMTNGLPYITNKYFILGSDELGRDIFTRLIYGVRISLFVGLGSILITFMLGIILGFAAGYFGGAVDVVLSRFTEMFLAFPIIFLVILIIAFFGNSLFTIIIVLGFSGWMSLFKLVRGEVISLKQKDFFITSKMLGLSKRKILFKEILPVILAPVIVNLIFQYGSVILAEAALSYLGLGTGNIYPSWGAMIEAGQQYLTQAWWMIFFPALFLFITLYTANNFGKEINKLINPRIAHD